MTEAEKFDMLLDLNAGRVPGTYKFPPRNECEEQTSMRWWYPRILGAGLPVKMPRTVLIDADYGDLLSALDDIRPTSLRSLVRRIRKAGQVLGWPLFLRTDLTSGKHSWIRTCSCPSWQVVARHVFALVEDTALKDIHLHAFAARELLPLRYEFHAFDGLPIAREFRFFVKNGLLDHVQPYWPPQVIQTPSRKDWARCLGEMSRIEDDELVHLSKLAELAGGVLGSYWSVDFAQHQDGSWYLIDMARGEISYRWDPDPDCGVATEPEPGVADENHIHSLDEGR